MSKQEVVKLVLACAVTLGVFALSGWGVHAGEMSAKAAIATSLAALSSAGVLAGLGSLMGGKPEEPEE